MMERRRRGFSCFVSTLQHMSDRLKIHVGMGDAEAPAAVGPVRRWRRGDCGVEE